MTTRHSVCMLCSVSAAPSEPMKHRTLSASATATRTAAFLPVSSIGSMSGSACGTCQGGVGNCL